MKKTLIVILIVLGMVAILGCTTTTTTPPLSSEEQAYAKEFFAISKEYYNAFEKNQIEGEKWKAKAISQEEMAKYYGTVYLPKIRELRDKAINLNPPERYISAHATFTSAMNGLVEGTEIFYKGFLMNNGSYFKQATPILSEAIDKLGLVAKELAEANKR